MDASRYNVIKCIKTENNCCLSQRPKMWVKHSSSSVMGFCLNYLLQASNEDMSELEGGMINIIKVFHKYSGKKCKLKKTELKELINNEMSHFIMVSYEIIYKQLFTKDTQAFFFFLHIYLPMCNSYDVYNCKCNNWIC